MAGLAMTMAGGIPLFHRQIKLTIAPPMPGTFTRVKTQEALVVTDLRITAKITKTLDKTPNDGTVTVYNLNPDHRSQFQGKGCRVWLEAGYSAVQGQPGTVSQVFVGDVRFAQSKREGVDWLTVLELGEGERAYKHSRVSLGVKAGQTRAAILKQVVKQAGWDLGDVDLLLPELQQTVLNGWSHHGPAWQAMDALCKPRGLSWSIQNGAIQVLPPKGAMPTPAIVLDSAHGLVGSPAFGSAPTKSKARTISIKALLQPDLCPGRLIALSSAAFTGPVVAQKVVIDLDSWGGPFFSDCEAVPA